MDTRNRYIKCFRSLFLLLALLVAGSVAGRGQTPPEGDGEDSSSAFDGYNGTNEAYQITNKTELERGAGRLPNIGESFPVPVHEYTIYVPNGRKRELFIREILENQLEPDFMWYVQWYLEDGSNVNFFDVISKAEKVGEKKGLPQKNLIAPGEDGHDAAEYDLLTKYDYPFPEENSDEEKLMKIEHDRTALRRANINNKPGLFWSRQIFNEYLVSRKWMANFIYFSRNSAHVMAKCPEEGSSYTVICDVSYNNDYGYDCFAPPTYKEGEEPQKCARLPQQFTAPTLAKRYKFHIRRAEENLITSKSDDFKKDTIYAPAKHEEGGINIQLPMPLDNYYWQEGEEIKKVEISPDWDKKITVSQDDLLKTYGVTAKCPGATTTLNNSYQVFTLEFPGNTIDEVKTFTVSHGSTLLAEYTIIPVEHAGFAAAVKMDGDEAFNDDMHHRPEDHPDMFEEIGTVDFDSFDGMETLMGVHTITGDEKTRDDEAKNYLKKNNALAVPISTEFTSYSFAYPSMESSEIKIPTIFSEKFTPQKNMYALYRTALRNAATGQNFENSLGKEWYSALSKSQKKKVYKWYCSPTIQDGLTSGMEYSDDFVQIFDRTYARHLRDAEGQKRTTDKYGFFLYVDAAQEAGKIISVPIDGKVCGGTELLITAWINNMTEQRDDMVRPNLNIHLVAEGENGEKVILQRITTGYALYKESKKVVNPSDPDKTITYAPHYIGRWQQFHCVTSVSEKIANKYGKFHIEIYNNAPSSEGNDFAIDDVRIYRKRLTGSARQANSLCEDANAFSIRLKYDELMSMFELELDEEIDSDYQPKDSEHNLLTKLKMCEDYKDENLPKYRRLQYYVFGIDNEWKDKLKEWANGKENIKKEIDEITADDQHLIGGEEGGFYLNMDLVRKIQALSFDDEKENDPLTNCFRYAELYYYNDEGYEYDKSVHGYCVFSTNTKLMHKGGSSQDVLAAYDEKTDEIVIQNLRLPNGTPARDYALLYIPSVSGFTEDDAAEFGDDCGIYVPFKLEKAADLVTVVKDGDVDIDNVENVEAGKTYTLKGNFTVKDEVSGELKEVEDATFDWFFGSYDEFMNPEKGIKVGEKQLSIHEALQDYHGNEDDMDKHQSKYLDAIKELLGTENVIEAGSENPVDLSNKELAKIKLVLHAQKITIKTPEDFTNQLMVVTPNPSGEYTEENSTLYCINPREVPLGDKATIIPGDPEVPEYPSNYTLGIRLGMGQITEMVGATAQKKLQVPLHWVEPFNTENQKHQRYFLEEGEGKKDVKVSWSSDPSWKDFTNTVAEITKLEAELQEVENKKVLTWDNNYFQLQFNDKAKSFKEGYVYWLQVPFAEQVEVTVPTAEEGGTPTTEDKTLTGTFDVVLKIVPEYVTYQGDKDDSRNWNNDNLWYRATQEDLYDADDNRSNKYLGKENAGTFTPMDFTNVIIQNKKDGQPYSAYPYLYELKVKGENNPVLNMTAKERIGEATPDIEYDLAVDEEYMKVYGKEDKALENVFACVRFYGNTCQDIYFKPQTEMPHTEFLTYTKAWIDYELDANRWYTLASPLKGVVAGDMYLPSATVTNMPHIDYAVQKAPAFEDITYDGTKGTRWDPPVYMRGWNKTGSGTVVVPGDGKAGIQYGQAAAWSNLYNDVKEPFTPITGFSIGVKADQTKLGENKVLFRLPKADTNYTYHPNEGGNSGNGATITRNNAGRLITDDKEIKYFSDNSESGLKLVGNPFMAHLDMNQFLGNGGKYYILTENGTEASVISDDFTVSTAADDATKVAPLQSFLVDIDNLPNGGFSTDMQTVADENGTPGLRSALISEPKPKRLPEIRITAERGGLKNTAVVAYLSYASNGYAEEEDASLLISKEEKAPQVYTAADKQMLAINLTNRLHDIPVGVYSADESPVTLTFSVSDRLSGVTLYDKREKRSYAVTEGTTLTIPGNTSGRYVLNGSVPTANEVVATNRIACYSSGNGRIEVFSADPLVRVMVYNMSGQLVVSRNNLNTPTTCVEGLSPGQIYIVRAETASRVQTEKVEVR